MSFQSSSVQAFIALLRAHAAVTRRLNAELAADHGLTLSDFEVLIRLSHAPERRMRRVDLADQVVLSASGVTRLLEGLEGQGFVERAACDSDRRVVYAVLTDAGQTKLDEASRTHFAQIDEYFGERVADDELPDVTDLLSRLAEPAA